MVIKHDDIRPHAVLTDHGSKKLVHHLSIGTVGKSEKELSTGDGTEYRDVDDLLLGKA